MHHVRFTPHGCCLISRPGNLFIGAETSRVRGGDAPEESPFQRGISGSAKQGRWNLRHGGYFADDALGPGRRLDCMGSSAWSRASWRTRPRARDLHRDPVAKRPAGPRCCWRSAGRRTPPLPVRRDVASSVAGSGPYLTTDEGVGSRARMGASEGNRALTLTALTSRHLRDEWA